MARNQAIIGALYTYTLNTLAHTLAHTLVHYTLNYCQVVDGKTFVFFFRHVTVKMMERKRKMMERKIMFMV